MCVLGAALFVSVINNERASANSRKSGIVYKIESNIC